MAKKAIKRKIKPLLATLRERQRYLAFEVLSEEPIDDFDAIAEAIMDESMALMGELGIGEAGIWILDEKWQPERQRGLIRVGNTHVDKMKTVLALISKIKNRNVAVRSLGVSGMINKAEQRYLAG